MPVTHLTSDEEFRSLLENNNHGGGGSGDKLFLVDFSATWCGPCKQIAPLYKKLSDKYSHANFQFCHVDVDECTEAAQEQGIKALPTFVFYKNSTSTELARLQGANPSALESKVEELSKAFPSHFSGDGQKLGGGGTGAASSSSTLTGSATGLSAEEIVSISQAKVPFDSGSCKVGVRFHPALGGALAHAKTTLRINGTEKVSTIREFVDSLLELSGISQAYQLHNSYPPGPLDEAKTVSDAGIAGAAVLVKFQKS